MPNIVIFTYTLSLQNTKKSWHPSTLKNQERVWKAEQAASEEKKRILELQREREQENDRTQLNEMAQRNFGAGGSHLAGDNRLHWMYDVRKVHCLSGISNI